MFIASILKISDVAKICPVVIARCLESKAAMFGLLNIWSTMLGALVVMNLIVI